MIALWWLYIGGRLAGHIWLTKRDRRAYARGYAAGEDAPTYARGYRDGQARAAHVCRGRGE